MLLGPSDDPRDHPSPGLCWAANDRWAIGWRGAVYLPGELAGEATVQRLLAAADRTALEQAVEQLEGVYGLFVLDRQRRIWRLFNDRTGMARLYYSDDRVATRFLELVRAAGKTAADAASREIVEFIFQGGNFGPQTPVEGIRRLRRGQSLEVDFTRQPAVEVVARPDPADRPFAADEVHAYFDDLVRALTGQKVSVDVTGGFDSRVIACLLNQRRQPFDCALAGVVGSNEQATALEVAASLGRELTYHAHDIATLEADLPQVFLDGDGLTEIPRLHRDRQLCLRRLAQGTEVMVHGGGGEFFRDNFFIQDFPFYGVPKADIERFYRLRIIPVGLPDAQLTPRALALREAVFAATKERLKHCRAATNNETYEQIYRDFRAPELFGASFSNYLHLGMQVAAPFLEHRMIRLAMRTPPWSRFFTLWHRRILTENCPALAALPTADGYTAISHKRRLAAEFGTFVRVQAGRIGRKLTERYLGKSLFHKVGELEADAPGYRDGLRRSKLLAVAVDRLQKHDILRSGLAVDELRNVHVGRIITMGTLLRFLDGETIAERRD